MKHYIAFKGKQVKHYMIGKEVSNTSFEGLVVVGDFIYERLQKGTTDVHFGGSNEPIVFDNDYTLYDKHFVNVEWHDMTNKEKRYYNKVLKDNNLCFKTFVLKGVAPLTHNTYKMECESLCWIDTEKMPISVNEKVMTYAEFKKLTFGENMNVVNSWDNGYSHWGSETSKMESVYNLLGWISSEHTEDAHDKINTNWKGGRVHCGELWTWQFDEHGALKLRLTEEEFHHSVVSNT